MAAEKITIARIGSFNTDKQGNKLINKNGKPYSRVLIDTTDGRKLSGFGSQTTSNWNEGMEVEVEITESNGYLNFSVPKNQGLSGIDSGKIDRIYSMVSELHKELMPKTGKQIAQEAQTDQIGPDDVPFPDDDSF